MSSSDRVLDDPFLRVLRARHPDVDVVLLPEVDAAPPDLRPATVGQALAVGRHAVAVLEALWERAGQRLEPPVRFWWGQADPRLQRYVVKAALTDLDPDAVPDVTGRFARALLDLGWQPQPSPAGQPSLLARVGSLDVKVTGADRGLAVEVVSDPLHLTPETLEAAQEAS